LSSRVRFWLAARVGGELAADPSGEVAGETTRLVDAYSTPTLLRLVAAHQIDSARVVTHRFGLEEFLDAYDVFGRAADTGAVKMVLSRR
jgi:threonine dehydrogenase-like Zn-dependent dehydrogenase